jgi:EAL domain-containing protein (putative c-di-GMP-specific phosphodiesterase class I)/GAF domain-containing protein
MRRHDEEARLDALYHLNLLDTAPSESFDRITRMAGQIFGLPIAAVSLTDRDRQWFKSRVGIEHWSIPRDKAPCAQVAETAETVLIPDLQADSVYRTSLLADQGVRFYAGASLTTREGHSLGALCVLGTEPRTASEQEMNALDDLAKMVMSQIELQHAFGRLDPLSGLPNRTQFLDDLGDLGRDHPGERRLAVLIDLARHDQLNNGIRVMGAAYLDRIVRDAARRVSQAVGRGCIAYHVAATQFAFVTQHEPEPDYLETLAHMLAAVRSTTGDGFMLATSIGVAPFVAGETLPTSVLRTAHSAAEDARSRPSMISIYSAAEDCAHQRRFRLLSDFGAALREKDGRQLSLVFQPRVDLTTGDCVGAEALLRWHHPELGAVSPGEFIPIIEQTALAGPMTRWVLDAALSRLACWRARGIALRLSVNVSASNLQDAGFARDVQLQILRHRLRPEWVELEVTESAVMGDIENAMVQLASLVDAGVHVAIDDFGTGYSSLAYLQKLPGRILKIDQSFIREIGFGDREETLVHSMIALAHGLGYHVVAEGIETADARDRLTAMGCDEGQGYLFGRPMAAPAFDDWLAAHVHRERAAVAA